MSVSRDFINCYSPEATGPRRRPTLGSGVPIRPDCRAISLAFGFRTAQDFIKTAVTIRQAGCLFLTLSQEVLQRLMKANRLIDLRTGSGPVGAKPDKLFHVRVSRHDLT